ncbi:MAG: Fe-S cluster assembly protein NifU [Phycisphaerae bacterium]|jgi:NifU-like protein|nr:Fe-S cluster assembly protein NifU [Phycisphaerae bacterium]
MWNYSEKLREHFFNPKNVGEIDNPDAEATIGNLMCGDALRLMLKLDDDERIVEAKFQTFGCASAIASASALTEMIQGKTIREVSTLTNDDIVDFLGGMPEAKVHCSVMGMEALHKAIASYRGEKSVPEEEGKIVCECFGVTDMLIEKVIREHDLKTVEEVTHYTKAGGGCGKCHDQIREIIAKVRGEVPAEAASETTGASRMTNIQRIRMIEDVIDRQIRPMLRLDAGDIELIDVDRNKVFVAMRGACAGCPVSGVTLQQVVQEKLRELVAPDIEVEEVKDE